MCLGYSSLAPGSPSIIRTYKSFLRERYMLHNKSEEVVQRAGAVFFKGV